MRRSAATATCSPIWCAGCSRTAPTRRSCPSRPTPTSRSETLLKRPADIIGAPEAARHPRVPLPRDLYGPGAPQLARRRARPPRAASNALLAEVARGAAGPARPSPLVDGRSCAGPKRPCCRPATARPSSGEVAEATPSTADQAMDAARGRLPGLERRRPPRRAPPRWTRPPTCWRRGAGASSHLLQAEAGKTLDDAVAEVREAVDFCRYYAAQARGALRRGREPCPARPAKTNVLRHRGRGVFVRISPLELPARDLPRPGQRGARRRQRRRRQARRADAADRGRGRAHPARGRRSGLGAASRAGRRARRRAARRAPARRRRRLHRLDRGRRG